MGTRSRSCSLHRQEDMTPKPLSLPKSLACRALGRFERVGYRDAGAGAAALAVRLLGTGRLRQRRFKLGWGVELGSGPPRWRRDTAVQKYACGLLVSGSVSAESCARSAALVNNKT